MVLTTHDMSDIEVLAERIILIGNGQKLYDGNLQNIKGKFNTTKRMIVEHQENDAPLNLLGCQLTSVTSERMELDIDLTLTSVTDVINQISAARNILDITVTTPPIEEIIVNMYKEYAL